MKRISLLLMLMHFLHAPAQLNQLNIAFNQIQVRQNTPAQYPKWISKEHLPQARLILVTDNDIQFVADRPYKLRRISTRRMPSGNMVYECRDENDVDVRVFLINNSRMYVYFSTYHILMHFSA